MSHKKLSYTDEKEGIQDKIYTYTNQVKQIEKKPRPRMGKAKHVFANIF